MREMLSAAEAARRTGVSERTVRRWIAQGQLPARRAADGSFAIEAADLRNLGLDVQDAAQMRDPLGDVRQWMRAAEARLMAIEARLGLLDGRMAALELAHDETEDADDDEDAG